MDSSCQPATDRLSTPLDSGRYVILLHRQPLGSPRRYERFESDESINKRGGDHYDWMFEADRCIATWATPHRLPIDTAGDVGAVRLPDHRSEYLQYEGEVSGNRGSVERVEEGRFEIIQAAPDRYVIQTRGIRHGVIVIYRTWCGEGVSFWRISFRRSAEGTPTRADAN